MYGIALAYKIMHNCRHTQKEPLLNYEFYALTMQKKVVLWSRLLNPHHNLKRRNIVRKEIQIFSGAVAWKQTKPHFSISKVEESL